MHMCVLSLLVFQGKLRLFPFPFHIPRAHTNTRPSPYQKFEGIKTQATPMHIYGETGLDQPAEHFRERSAPSPTYHDDQRLSHL